MVRKSCSKSQGQPLPGVRSAAIISIRREMLREGFTGTGRELEFGCRVAGDRIKGSPYLRPHTNDSHKVYYGIFLIWDCQGPQRKGSDWICINLYLSTFSLEIWPDNFNRKQSSFGHMPVQPSAAIGRAVPCSPCRCANWSGWRVLA